MKAIWRVYVYETAGEYFFSDETKARELAREIKNRLEEEGIQGWCIVDEVGVDRDIDEIINEL